ncbi:MAG TPA: uracil-DNA glycosylase family protein [Acidimicrobiia bacterium]|nr:uracil-DNA glycosylase family protein [Acidimicrobiia bacterium]
MDRATVDVYERAAQEWAAKRGPGNTERLDEFAGAIRPGAVVLDLGAGPGWHSARLPSPVIASDAAVEMVRLVPEHAPAAWPLVADLEALPVRRGALGAVWCQKTYHHVPAERLPLALWDLHRALEVGGIVDISVLGPVDDDPGAADFPGRHFSTWTPDALADVLHGAGFAVHEATFDKEWTRVRATRTRSLADTVGPDMRLLVVGLNPSEYSADRGVGFARPGNRFWPAALRAGIVTRERDGRHALLAHGVGMTDLVKRATPRADALTADEYRAGAARVDRLVTWLRPAAVCFVGLTGYRVAIDRHAAAGWQDLRVGGRPTYVMPNTSGVNGHASLDDLAEHLRTAIRSRPS